MEETPPVVNDLADAISQVNSGSTDDNRPSDGAVVRFGKVTAVGTGANEGKAQTDATGSYWNPVDASYYPYVGDLVYMLSQGPVSHIAGRLGGTPTGMPVGGWFGWSGTALPDSSYEWCRGGEVSRTGATAELFSRLGTRYGAGNGTTTFNLPNFTDRVPVASGTAFPVGETGGAETRTLTTAQMPAHTHAVDPSAHSHVMDHGHTGNPHTHTQDPHTHVNANGGGTVTAATGTAVTAAGVANLTTGSTTATNNSTTATVDNFVGSTGSTNLPSTTSASTGGGDAFNNMPPYQSVDGYIIKARR